MRRGFCIAQAFDLISFSNLIAANRIYFEDRCLGATKFKQGNELNQYANQEDSRRVILKKVLNQISQEDLYAAIENCLGQIKRIYRFEPEDHQIAAKKSVLKKSRTFSVEFCSVEIARKAVELRSLNLSCMPAPILIEAFRR